ncbi:hypothetical protein TIFTF001_014730 [Ficus carica]|uniref:chloroplast protein-transporting ATPase n=1 Tax=Ficus carica TaxID=3494 RepID=A0AA88ARQ8_FICCA|nr:hypothetical protein TIFTF001_014730 [Ficus carica]
MATMSALHNSLSFSPKPTPRRPALAGSKPFFLPPSFSSSSSSSSFRRRRRRFGLASTLTSVSSTPVVAVASLKENLGGLTKTWSDFTSLNYWVVRDYYRLVKSVNALEPQIQKLSNEQLRAKTMEFRQRLREGQTLADIQAEAFAVVREAAKRKLGMRHFDVQIIGGAVLHDGSIAEMKTGEGKTLVSTLAAYLNALTGEGVHVVTVNDYLAQRDAEWMGPVHRFLGLFVGLIQELGFDYLLDNLAGNNGQLVMKWPKPFHFAIVDEVDSVLIDNGRNPLLISGEHYNVELKDNSVELTEEGIELAEMALETHDLWDESDPWARFVMNALKAKEFYQRDVQYIVKNGQALIINEEKEFLKMFQMPVIEVPTNLPNIRKIYQSKLLLRLGENGSTFVKKLKTCLTGSSCFSWDNKVNLDFLVSGQSVENSEYLSDLLTEWNIPHNILNARSKMLAKEIIEDSLLLFLTKEAPNIEVEGETGTQKALPKIKVGPSSFF